MIDGLPNMHISRAGTVDTASRFVKQQQYVGRWCDAGKGFNLDAMCICVCFTLGSPFLFAVIFKFLYADRTITTASEATLVFLPRGRIR